METPVPAVDPTPPTATGTPVRTGGGHLRTSHARRALYSILGVIAVLVVGTFGIHAIEGARWVDAFYFESMLATGQGPPFPLTTDSGKIFASVMAFVSVGSVVTTFVFTIGPVLQRWWREGLERLELDARELGTEVQQWERRR